jgi:predicted methyltransferase
VITSSRSVVALAAISFAACLPVAPQPPPGPEPPPATPATTGAPAAPPMAVSPAIRAVLDAPDRSAADRALDQGRHPGEMLAFFGIRPGMKVAELMAGGGYTSELLARAVGPKGKVWGQNNRFVLDRFAEKPWAARLATPVMKNVMRVDRELEDPLPPEAKNLDAVLMVLFYHDAFWMKVDRMAMNKAIFASLKKGGVYGVIDHSGRPGTGSTEVKSLHRVEEKLVREEIEAAGFRFEGSAEFLRNPADTRDWNDAPGAAGGRRGQSDRFVLKFVKP